MSRIKQAAQAPDKPIWGGSNYKDVVRGQFQFRESLPLPVVNYPADYGTWIFFQETEVSQPFLCDCMKRAAVNFLHLTERASWFHAGASQNILEYLVPPILRSCNQLSCHRSYEVGELPLFRPAVCHICNRRVPPIRWSNLDEHSAFVQHFGWFFHHALLSAGFSSSGEVLPHALDPEIAPLIEVDFTEAMLKIRELMLTERRWWKDLEGPPDPRDSENKAKARDIHQRVERQTAAVLRLVEERMRRRLGFPPRGKTGISQRILFWIVTSLFSDCEVLFRARPDFLKGLELDIFIPSRSLGIEYQGEQHFEPFEHLGGEKGLVNVQRRDRSKARLCKCTGVRIEYFSRADKLTEEFVAARLRQYL